MEQQKRREVNDWKEKLRKKEDLAKAVTILGKMPAPEITEILQDLENEIIVEVFPLLPESKQGLVFAEFSMPRRIDLFHNVSKRWFAGIFEKAPSDERADTFQQLTKEEQVSLLPYIQKSIRDDVLQLSKYPPETAGGIMSTDFCTINGKETCSEAIEKLRREGSHDKLLYYIYVVDENMKLLGFITLKDLMLANPNEIVLTIVGERFPVSELSEDRELVAAKIEKYELIAIPVVNQNRQLVGIVHHDDALEVIREEHTEDMEKFMGIVPGKGILNYNETSVWGHFRKRIIWLAILAIVGVLSGMIIRFYEGAISAFMILALYMPMVADTGGNSGSQAATVVIRAIALGQVSLKNWIYILIKEIRISILLALALGIIAFLIILFLSWEVETPLQHSLFYTASVISLALALQVISSTMIGAGLPLLVKRMGGDPALAASPAITTAVDISGLLIYFSIATLLLF